MNPVDDSFGQAVARHQAGDLDAAERLYRQILDGHPAHAGSLANLGVLLARRGQLAEAVALYQSALAAQPDQPDAHFNLGNVYRRMNRPADAAAAYRAAVGLDPNHARAYLNLGLALGDGGDLPAAVDAFRSAVRVDPDMAEGYNLLGDALFRGGKSDESVHVFREFTGRAPGDPRGHHNLGLALASRGQYDAALPELEEALRLRPDYPDAHNSLGVTLEALGRPDDAQTHYREAARLRPNFADALSNLGTSLTEQGRTAEAADALRAALAARPDPRTHSNLLLNCCYTSALTPEQLRDEHVAWARAYADPLTPAAGLSPADPDPDRKLKIGYVSADFRTHTAAGFLELLLTHHDRTRFHVTCYANVPRPDDTTDRLRHLADGWRAVHAVGDAHAADAVRADGIDVLIDVSGHTAGNRLPVFARRPAPVQAALFGYPATTGVRAIDWKLSDPYADPEGDTDHLYAERVYRLPDVGWVYRPPDAAPDVNGLPAADRTTFTFGCLNNPAKLSDACVAAWAQVLKAVGRSRLVLLAGKSPDAARRITAKFSAAGVSPDRLQLVYRLPPAEYFEAYQPIDLCLDPFPYNGGVTTCDALWMGVPVLTVAGADCRSRQGVSLLSNLGLPEFIADSADKLPDLAAGWSEQRAGLADVRESLREMMRQSPVTDAERYVRNLEAAYRQMWRAAVS